MAGGHTGQVLVQCLDPEGGGLVELGHLEGLLRQLTPHLQYAMARRTGVALNARWNAAFYSPAGPLQHRLAPTFLGGASEFGVPDAYGFQGIRAPLADQLHLDDRWTREDLDDRMVLLRATDLGSWFTPELPPVEVLQAARESFGSIFLEQEDLWRDVIYRAEGEQAIPIGWTDVPIK